MERDINGVIFSTGATMLHDVRGPSSGPGLHTSMPGLAMMLIKCTEELKEEITSSQVDPGMPVKRRRVVTEIIEQPLGLMRLPHTWAYQQTAPTLSELRYHIAATLKEHLATVETWTIKFGWDDSAGQMHITSDTVLQGLVNAWNTESKGLPPSSMPPPKVYLYTQDESYPRSMTPVPPPFNAKHDMMPMSDTPHSMASSRHVEGLPATPVLGARKGYHDAFLHPYGQHIAMDGECNLSTMAAPAHPYTKPHNGSDDHHPTGSNMVPTDATMHQRLSAETVNHLQSGTPSSRRSVAVPVTPFSNPGQPARAFDASAWDTVGGSQAGQSLLDLHGPPVNGAAGPGSTGIGLGSPSDLLPPIRTGRADMVPMGAGNGLYPSGVRPYDDVTGQTAAQRLVNSEGGARLGSYEAPGGVGGCGMNRSSTVTTGGGMHSSGPLRAMTPGGVDMSGSPSPHMGVTISTALPARQVRAYSAREGEGRSGGGATATEEDEDAAGEGTGWRGRQGGLRGTRGSSASLATMNGAVSGGGGEDGMDGQQTGGGEGRARSSADDEEGEDEGEGQEGTVGQKGKKKQSRAKPRRAAKGRESDTKFADGRKKDERAHAASMAGMVDACGSMFGNLSHLVEVVDYKHIQCLACSPAIVVKAYSAYHTACIRKHFLRHHQALLSDGGADLTHFKEYKVSSKPTRLGGSNTDLQRLASIAGGIGSVSMTNISGMETSMNHTENTMAEDTETGAMEGTTPRSTTSRRTKRQAASTISAAIAAEAAAGPTRSSRSSAGRAAGARRRGLTQQASVASAAPGADTAVGIGMDTGTPQSAPRTSPFQDAAKLCMHSKHLAGMSAAGPPGRLPSGQMPTAGGGSGANATNTWSASPAPTISGALMPMSGRHSVVDAWRPDPVPEGPGWVVTGGAGGVTDNTLDVNPTSSPSLHMMRPASPIWATGLPPVTTAIGSAASYGVQAGGSAAGYGVQAWGVGLNMSQRLPSSFASLDVPPLLSNANSGPVDSGQHGSPVPFITFKPESQGYNGFRSGAVPVTSGHARGPVSFSAEPSRLGPGLQMVDPMAVVSSHTPVPTDPNSQPQHNLSATQSPMVEPREPGLPSPLSGPGYGTPYGYDSLDPQTMVDFLSSLKRSGEWTSQLGAIRDGVAAAKGGEGAVGGLLMDGHMDGGVTPSVCTPGLDAVGASTAAAASPIDPLLDNPYNRPPAAAQAVMGQASGAYSGHMFRGEGTIMSAGALMHAMHTRPPVTSGGGGSVGVNGHLTEPASGTLVHQISLGGNAAAGMGTPTHLPGQEAHAPSWPTPNLMLDQTSLEPMRHSPVPTLAANGVHAGMHDAPAEQAQGAGASMGGVAAAVVPMGAPVDVGGVVGGGGLNRQVVSDDDDDAPGFGFCSDKLMNYSYAQLLRVHPELNEVTPEGSGAHHT